MTKNLITIYQFINKSLGEWKSIRSTHTLAFQEFENSTSKIYIKNLKTKNEFYKNNTTNKIYAKIIENIKVKKKNKKFLDINY